MFQRLAASFHAVAGMLVLTARHRSSKAKPSNLGGSAAADKPETPDV